jgi:hypothetical protein
MHQRNAAGAPSNTALAHCTGVRVAAVSLVTAKAAASMAVLRAKLAAIGRGTSTRRTRPGCTTSGYRPPRYDDAAPAVRAAEPHDQPVRACGNRPQRRQWRLRKQVSQEVRDVLTKLDSPENVLALEIVGKFEKSDYESVFLPALNALNEATGEYRVVFVFGDRYEGLTAGATWEDMKFGVGEVVHRDYSKWKRCAIVTELHWLRHSISLFRWIIPGEVEVFENAEVDKAIAWAAA